MLSHKAAVFITRGCIAAIAARLDCGGGGWSQMGEQLYKLPCNKDIAAASAA
jgi:hypothetical protein